MVIEILGSPYDISGHGYMPPWGSLRCGLSFLFKTVIVAPIWAWETLSLNTAGCPGRRNYQALYLQFRWHTSACPSDSRTSHSPSLVPWVNKVDWLEERAEAHCAADGNKFSCPGTCDTLHSSLVEGRAPVSLSLGDHMSRAQSSWQPAVGYAHSGWGITLFCRRTWRGMFVMVTSILADTLQIKSA